MPGPSPMVLSRFPTLPSDFRLISARTHRGRSQRWLMDEAAGQRWGPGSGQIGGLGRVPPPPRGRPLVDFIGGFGSFGGRLKPRECRRSIRRARIMFREAPNEVSKSDPKISKSASIWRPSAGPPPPRSASAGASHDGCVPISVGNHSEVSEIDSEPSRKVQACLELFGIPRNCRGVPGIFFSRNHQLYYIISTHPAMCSRGGGPGVP